MGASRFCRVLANAVLPSSVVGNNTKGKEKLDIFVGDIPPSNANMSSVSAGSPAVSVWTSPAGSSDMNGPSAAAAGLVSFNGSSLIVQSLAALVILFSQFTITLLENSNRHT